MYPLSAFYKNLAWGGCPRSAPLRQISPLWLQKCGLTAPKIAKMVTCGINLPLRQYSAGSTEKLEYRCTTTNLPACNDVIIVLKILLLHNISVIPNFVTPKRDKQTDRQPVRGPQSPPYLAR